MVSVKSELKGTRKIIRELRKAESDMTDFKQATTKIAALVVPVVKTYAPKSNTPGKSKRNTLSGSVRASATKTCVVLRAGGKRVPYANAIHWGWSRHNIRSNPFMTRAAQSTETRWRLIYKMYIDRAINQIKGNR